MGNKTQGELLYKAQHQELLTETNLDMRRQFLGKLEDKEKT
jgi:hypothetical protein